jgi:hypothetical protein
MTKAQRDIKRKLRVLSYAQEIGNISKTCRYFGIPRQTCYEWKQAYTRLVKKGLINRKPCPESSTIRIPPKIEGKIIYLGRAYHLGQLRISWFLDRYHA